MREESNTTQAPSMRFLTQPYNLNPYLTPEKVRLATPSISPTIRQQSVHARLRGGSRWQSDIPFGAVRRQ